MHKDRRSDLNVARRTLRVTWTSGEALMCSRPSINSLHCMNRQWNLITLTVSIGFPAAYFSRLTSLGGRLGIALAWLDDQLAVASIFLAGRDSPHDHLACGNEIGMKHRAATMLVVEGAKWARKQGCKLLHLSGGLHPGDTLEFFKCSFGGRLYRYAYL
jgi:hypothetical protein